MIRIHLNKCNLSNCNKNILTHHTIRITSNNFKYLSINKNNILNNSKTSKTLNNKTICVILNNSNYNKIMINNTLSCNKM